MKEKETTTVQNHEEINVCAKVSEQRGVKYERKSNFETKGNQKKTKS